jgi:hypothetical protein
VKTEARRKVSQQSQNAIGQYAFIFPTPHVRVKFHPAGAFSPWLSFGGGDTRPIVHILKIPIGFRIEVRDFYSGLPNYNQKVTGNLQNNLSFNGGFLIRF